jgi:hypothetical protein
MIGGSPIFMPQPMPFPGMQPGRPQGAPQPPRQPAPPQQAGGYVPPRLAPPRSAPAQAAPTEPPAPRLVRGVRPSGTGRGPAPIPTPEELGIGAAPRQPDTLDWAAARRRMKDLGVSGFKLEQVAGGTRFTCWVGDRTVQADGATEAEAVALCLDRVGPQAANRR